MLPRFVGVLVVVASVIGCRPKPAETNEAKAAPVHVEKTQVGEQAMPRALLLTGTLRGKQQTDLAANASGRVVATFVERGTTVKKGDVLATLDVRAAALTASEARANAELSRAVGDTAKRECERYQKLLEQGAISQAEFDRTSDQCRTSVMSLQAAQARAQVAAQVVGDGTIRAPFSGVVAERFVETGTYVRPETRVVTLMSLDSLRVEFTVPEANLGSVKEGGSLSFSVPAYPDRTFAATVRYIGAAVREATRDLVVEAVAENDDRALRPGMFATVSLLVGESAMPVVPKPALVEKDGRMHAYAVVDQRLEERVVQTGPERGDLVGILHGLKRGDTIVSKPSDGLRNGQVVD